MLKPNKNKNGTGSYSFSQDNYNAGLCGKGHLLRKDITQGDPTYDGARANMGEPWMMPTYNQGKELIDNTIYEWATVNDLKYGKFTSKKYSSKYIFIPTAGFYKGSYPSYTNDSGSCWITHIGTYDSQGYDLTINSNPTPSMAGSANRYIGISIRPVAPKRPW